MEPIVLASSSPRRRELLEQYNIPYIVDFEEIEEVLDESLTLFYQLQMLAIDKGKVVASRHLQEVVISCDTMVCLHDKMLGKANNRQHAREMLQAMSNQKQTVYSAVAIFYKGQIHTFVESSDVYFKLLSSKEIEDYLDTNEWVGKAGAYAIQGIGNCLVEKVEGSFETIIGFPVFRILEVLVKIKTI